MEQEMKWIGYLQLGVISVLCVFLLAACEKYVPVKRDFRYINETNHKIYLHAPADGTVTLTPLDTGFLYSGQIWLHRPDLKTKSTLTGFTPPMVFLLKYDDLKCDSLNNDSPTANPKNYEAEDIGNEHYLHTYRFTEADYERAEDCE